MEGLIKHVNAEMTSEINGISVRISYDYKDGEKPLYIRGVFSDQSADPEAPAKRSEVIYNVSEDKYMASISAEVSSLATVKTLCVAIQAKIKEIFTSEFPI